jgi:hypothetical protein
MNHIIELNNKINKLEKSIWRQREAIAWWEAVQWKTKAILELDEDLQLDIDVLILYRSMRDNLIILLNK